MFDSSTGSSLATALSEVRPLANDQLERLFVTLIARVRQLHSEGRIHGAITTRNIHVESDDQIRLALPAEKIDLKQSADQKDLCPPELRAAGLWQLSSQLSAAQRECEAHGLQFDPRRIDLFQLGVLLCRLSSGESLSNYLRFARTRGLVPPALRSVIDRALGYDAEDRFESCDQMGAAFQEAVRDSDPASFKDTPALGSSFPVQSSTSDTPATGYSAATDAKPKPVAEAPIDRLGVYRIIERIGGGGMGDVYKAHDASLDRIVAIKVLPAELARNTDFVHRFRAEAMAIAKLMHPNVVQVFACGEDAGRHFFAMQFVDGESLAGLLRRRKKLTVDEALPIIEQCLAGLGAAHKRNLIHRDIKPGNILLDREHHRALVADFGLVKTGGGEENFTATGVIMGTVDYIPPEQVRGQKVDARSDLYSIGVLMYQMLAGRLPFVSDSPTGMIFQHAFEQPTPLKTAAPDVPQRLADLVMKLMSKDAANRYQSADEVLAELRAFRVSEPHSQPSTSGEAQSSIITAPEFNSSPAIPSLVLEPARAERTGWLERLQQLFRTQVEAGAGNEATQAQMDGAVAEYELRHQQLTALVKEAESVAAEFRTQAKANRKAAAAASRRAESAKDSEIARLASHEQAECERTAADFEAQLAEQEDQLEAIRTRLRNVDATLQQLRSQRDVLQSRLAAARAQLGPNRARAQTNRKLYKAIIPITACLAGVFLLYRLTRPMSEAFSEVSATPAAPQRTALETPTASPSTTALAPTPPSGPPQAELSSDLQVPATVAPGLLVAEYPRHSSQNAGSGGFVPIELLGAPIGEPRVTATLNNWTFTPARNAVARGWLRIDEPGEYAFNSDCFYDQNALYLNGRLLCPYRDGEITQQRITLERGFVPIASMGYTMSRGSVHVKWKPPGQAQLSEIPDELLVHDPKLSSALLAVAAKTDSLFLAKKPRHIPVQTDHLLTGLRTVQYARQPSQSRDSLLSGSFPLPGAAPVGAPEVVHSLFPSKLNGANNTFTFGYLRIDQEGEYAFSSSMALCIAGRPLIRALDGVEGVKLITLKPGLTPFLTVSYLTGTHMQATWRPPYERELVPIPAEAMFNDPQELIPSLPGQLAPGSISLVGRTTVKKQDVGLVLEYETGKHFDGKRFEEELKKLGHPLVAVQADLKGVLQVPRPMHVAVWAKGGITTATLFIDGREIGVTGDDKPKDVVYRVPLVAGEHQITWSLYGGTMGAINVLEFYDLNTHTPLMVRAAASDVIAVHAAPVQSDLKFQGELPNFGSPAFPEAIHLPPIDVAVTDRLAAEWVLGMKGAVLVKADKQSRWVAGAADRLPPGELQLDAINWSSNQHIINDDLIYLSGLQNVSYLNFGSSTRIGDLGMKYIGAMHNVETLVLDRTPVSGLGLSYLTGLAKLRRLDLVKAVRSTDPALVHLQHMNSLAELNLDDTLVGDPGMIHLTKVSNLQTLSLNGTRLTDTGLAQLSAIRGLKKLSVERTKVSAAAVARFQEAMPNCTVSWDNARSSPAAAGTLLKVPVEKDLSIPLCYIPAGTFMMGSPETEASRRSEEAQHLITLTKPFYMAQTEVTQALWQLVMGENPSHFQGDLSRPVDSVTWAKCQDFVGKLNSRFPNGEYHFRIPTEAEWEYACRAGTTTVYSSGDRIAANVSWYRANTLNTTHPVAAMAPNAWGLYDMHGNLQEWCADWYDTDYYLQSPALDPTGPSSGTERVLRGGSWRVAPDEAHRCASRSRYQPDGPVNSNFSNTIGLRLACDVREAQ